MTLAGKKLQIIYDSGTESLSNIETDSIAKLTGSANKHSAQQRATTATHSSVVEGKSQEIESDLHELMEKSVQKLSKLKDNEIEKCKEHTDALTEELRRIRDLVKESVESIKAGLSDRLNDVDHELSSEFDKTYEQNVASLMGSNFEVGKEIRTHANGLTNALQQKLDQSVWESKGSEKQIVAQLYKNYMTKASAIETHFSQIMQKLSAEFQVQYKKVEEGASKSKADISNEIDKALAEVDQASSESDRDINQFFLKLVSEHEAELDGELEKVSREITQTHNDATGNLKTKTQDYSSSLLTAATTALEALKTSCSETIENAESLHDDFLARMDERVEGTKTTREQLESTKSETITEICDELSTMRKGFEDNLDKLTRDAGDSVQTVAQEVEKEIKTAHNRCVNKLADDGQSARDSIDKETKRVLALIAEHKRAALEEIAQAAGG
ncbi:MAG: hypothetical protein SGJ27_19125 [Candidatus Melainabacteria bacterium]|nr:hypothetical protein [Candidatus Melainabacteria bacterium]